MGASRLWTRAARAGSPGAGYFTWKSSRANSPKSWIVRGVGMPVTQVPGTYQWAETARIALGRGIVRPIRAQASVKGFLSMAFVGLPWPKKIAGMGEGIATDSLSRAVLAT